MTAIELGERSDISLYSTAFWAFLPFLALLYCWGTILSVPSIQIIYASTSGHTEYVVQKLVECLEGEKCKVQSAKAEASKPDDLLKGDLLILASGTWNTGGVEGQMNPHMHEFLLTHAKDINLKGKNVMLIALGDHRYFYTCRAGEHMRNFVIKHGGTVIEPSLLIVNEPYGQEEKIEKWSTKVLSQLSA